jgi:hypothetical protein
MGGRTLPTSFLHTCILLTGDQPGAQQEFVALKPIVITREGVTEQAAKKRAAHHVAKQCAIGHSTNYCRNNEAAGVGTFRAVTPSGLAIGSIAN